MAWVSSSLNVHVLATSAWQLDLFIFNAFALLNGSLLHYLGSNEEHIDNSHPRSSVTHAEQGEQLLPVSERVTFETLLARTPLTI